MANNLRCSAAEESDDTLNVFHSPTKSWSCIEDPVVPLGRNLYGHPLAGLLWERQFEEILLKYVWEKVSNWDCVFVHREKRVVLNCVCG